MLQVAPWPCLPAPGHCMTWPYDPELERLRRLQERTRIEEQKQDIREWLRRHGVAEREICPTPFMPFALPKSPPLGGKAAPPSVQDVLKRIK